MSKRGDVPTQHDITEKVDSNRDDMREKESDLATIATDKETVTQTKEGLDFGGTAEGANDVEQAMETAEDVTVDVFDREDDSLEELRSDNEEFEGEVHERSDSVQSDLDKISDAAGQVDTQETTNELTRAEEAPRQDIEFLNEQEQRAREARDESERIQQELQSRAHAGRGRQHGG